ncbi:MAG: tRNA (adenosine(37)-N6)-threonylcarbamoyltransferase complex ATPase subunit type 1 TsaE [Opitutae bacterium]|nr:tRNA (adenosine(37)-N6)-threonylcarbamoyltransferase complex ATPase subunit type 1 TsaE [Opitutae bacterium]
MKSEKLNYDINNLDQAAEFILNNSVYNMILFKADLGVGKTTLIKEICKKIGTIDNVVSPTFPILNVYKSKNDLIYHMDLYRVENLKDLNELGFFDVIEQKNWIFIEWPDNFEKVFNKNHTLIEIKLENDNSRTITLTQNEII